MRYIQTIVLACAFLLLTAQHSLAHEDLIKKYAGKQPAAWGRHIQGVITKIDTAENILALTFDLCGFGYDDLDLNIVEYLTANQIPATIFVTSAWISRHPQKFDIIANNPLFDIQNHGSFHKPASVSGNTAYNIQGTKNAADLLFEIEYNADKIERMTGKRPLFYRAGTAFYDEYAVEIIKELGFKPISYMIDGDFGARYKPWQIKKALLSARPGDIILLHLNRPKRQTFNGLVRALPVLKERGFKFVKLSDYSDKLI